MKTKKYTLREYKKTEAVSTPSVIIKVQRSQMPSGGLWIYDENMNLSIQWWEKEDPIAYAQLSKIMGMKQKEYFKAHLEEGRLVIDDNAEWQSW